MSEHLHDSYIPGCPRCSIGLDELTANDRVSIRVSHLQLLEQQAKWAETHRRTDDRFSQYIRERLDAWEASHE